MKKAIKKAISKVTKKLHSMLAFYLGYHVVMIDSGKDKVEFSRFVLTEKDAKEWLECAHKDDGAVIFDYNTNMMTLRFAGGKIREFPIG